MKLYIISIIIACLLNVNIYAKEIDVFEVFSYRKIDISTKSYLGWARVLNDGIKRKEYHLDDLDQETIYVLTLQLKDLSKSYDKFEGKLK